jgi:hypothetical protein
MRAAISLVRAVLLGSVLMAITGVAAWYARQVLGDGTLADWFGAIGTGLAIAVTATFGIDQLSQARRDDIRRRHELGEAAFTLADQAMTLVTDRLETALSPRRVGSRYQLRGDRTTETIEAMREIEPHMLPPNMIAPFVELRACVAAINSAITEYHASGHRRTGSDDGGGVAKAREKAFSSSARVHQDARKAFLVLAATIKDRSKLSPDAHRSEIVTTALNEA